MTAGEKGSTVKKLRIGVLDIVIIVAVIALIVTAIVRYTSDAGWLTPNKNDCSITFTVSGLRYTAFDTLQKGETVYLESGEAIGILNEAGFTPALFYATGADGVIIDAHYPENTLIDINGVVLGKLVSNDNGYFTPNGVHICPGVTLTAHTRTTDLVIKVTSVTPAETN